MKLLAIDYGDARTGFAASDPTGLLASALPQFASRKPEEVAKHAAVLASRIEAQGVVLGLPRNMDGSEGFRAEKTKLFAALLRPMLAESCPLIFWDERNTTVSATQILNETNTRGKKRKEILDSVSAVIILQSYLDHLRLQNQN